MVLAAGVRPGTPLVLAPPSLYALVLAVLLASLLVQSGALDPLRLMSSSRSALANANGMVLLGALFLASAQVFTMLTPESGLPRIIMSLYFLVLMFHTMAAGPDRVRLLRSLGVTFGVAFTAEVRGAQRAGRPCERPPGANAADAARGCDARRADAGCAASGSWLYRLRDSRNVPAVGLDVARAHGVE